MIYFVVFMGIYSVVYTDFGTFHTTWFYHSWHVDFSYFMRRICRYFSYMVYLCSSIILCVSMDLAFGFGLKLISGTLSSGHIIGERAVYLPSVLMYSTARSYN